MISLDNEEERGILRKFQDIVSDLEEDEVTCIRFLIARNFDTSKAEDMMRENHKWRKEIDIENIYSWIVPDYMNTDLPFSFPGRTKYGGPVLWLPLGRWLAREWVEKGKKDEITRYGYHILENALTRLNQFGHKRIVALLCVKDLTYYKVAHMDTLRVLYAGFQALERNYPEILEHLIVINAPWVFTIGFNFVKPILSPRTLDKIQVHGSDKSKWLPIVREICPDEAIPEEYLSSD